MEIVFWACVVLLLWVATFTILLPLVILLKYSKGIQALWFSFMYMILIKPVFMTTMVPLRKKVFDLLNEKLSGRDVTKPIKVLEIGIAFGANLQFYPENSHLTALDVNANFQSYFEKHQKKFSHIVYERTIVSPAENMKDIDSCSMDVVVSTYVLCSVKVVKDTLKEIKRVLKPGGTYLFLEHVGYPESEWGHTVQKCIQPIWTLHGAGCTLTTKHGDSIQNAGFSDVNYKQVRPPSVNYFVRPEIYGFATK